jgi:hypothetical protein
MPAAFLPNYGTPQAPNPRSAFGDQPSPNERANIAIEQELVELDRWATKSAREAKRDRGAFWMLKAPAIGCAALVSLFELLRVPTMVIVLSISSGLLAAVDALRPRGQLHDAHVKCAHEIRALAHELRSRYQQAKLLHQDASEIQRTAAQLLEEARLRRKAIMDVVAAAEANLAKPL